MRIRVEELNEQPLYYAEWTGAAKRLVELGYRPIKQDYKTWEFLCSVSQVHRHRRLCTIALLDDGLLHINQEDDAPKSNNMWYWEKAIECVNEIYNACDKAGLLERHLN